MSDTDLVDSTSPSAPPASRDVPGSGSWTNTPSPRASWAKSVMPTRTLPSSRRAHSWSLVYLRSSGTFTKLGSYRMGRPQRRGPGEGRNGDVGLAVDVHVHAASSRQGLDRSPADREPGLECGRVTDRDHPIGGAERGSVDGDGARLRGEGGRRPDPLAVHGERLRPGIAQLLHQVDP